MNTQFGIAGLLRVARRHPWLVTSFLVLGILAGAGYVHQRPTARQAQASVILPSSSLGTAGQALRDMKTEAQIAESSGVLASAAKSLHPPIAAHTLAERVSVRAASEDILVVTAHAASDAPAIAYANAVANAYVSQSTTQAAGESTTLTSTLSQQVSQLTSQIQQLQTQIADSNTRLASLPPNSARAAHESSILASLQTEETNAAAQLNNVENDIDSAKISQVLTGLGTRILDPATSASPSSPFAAAIAIALGLVIGLIVGMSLALAIDRGNHRLRSRDDIADAIGVPVIASMTCPRRAGPKEVSSLLTRPEPSPVEGWAMRRALHRLGVATTENQARLSVVSLANDPAALLVGPLLASYAASINISTGLVVTTQSTAAASLRAAIHAIPQPGPHLVAFDSEGDADASTRDARLVVSVGVYEPPNGLVTLGAGDGIAIIAVSSNIATAEQLAQLAIATTETRQALMGIIVVNTDADDTTTGRSLQVERLSAAVPRRVTGTTKDSA